MGTSEGGAPLSPKNPADYGNARGGGPGSGSPHTRHQNLKSNATSANRPSWEAPSHGRDLETKGQEPGPSPAQPSTAQLADALQLELLKWLAASRVYSACRGKCFKKVLQGEF